MMKDNLVNLGLTVFPLPANRKYPPPERFYEPREYEWPELSNIGVSTDRLLVVDFDGKQGLADLDDFEMFHGLPTVWMVTTPSGGRHIYFRLPEGIKVAGSIKKLGKGTDIKSWHGYVVGPSSSLNGKSYEWIRRDGEMPVAPQWLIDLCGQPVERKERKITGLVDDSERNRKRFEEFLSFREPAIEGCGGNKWTFDTACVGWDYALSKAATLHAMLGDWNDRCQPRWDVDDLEEIVDNAYRYAHNDFGRDRLSKPDDEFEAVQKPARKHERIDGNALRDEKFAPLSWVVPNYVTEGLTILGGRPKLGKSWMALGICIGVATGGLALGEQCPQGDVLYLALEDNKRRLQSRINKVLQGEVLDLSRAKFQTTAPLLGQGLIEELEDWRLSVKKPVLLAVDTAAKVRPPKGRNEDSYTADYKAISKLQEWATQHRIALIVVMHVRKADAEDPLEKISGTNGLTGAADTILVLDRDRDGAKLLGRGRDIEEDVEKVVVFDKRTGTWSVAGNAADIRQSDERASILGVLEEATASMSPTAIARAIGSKVNNVNQLLFKMVEDGQALRLGRGKYALGSGTEFCEN